MPFLTYSQISMVVHCATTLCCTHVNILSPRRLYVHARTWYIQSYRNVRHVKHVVLGDVQLYYFGNCGGSERSHAIVGHGPVIRGRARIVTGLHVSVSTQNARITLLLVTNYSSYNMFSSYYALLTQNVEIVAFISE